MIERAVQVSHPKGIKKQKGVESDGVEDRPQMCVTSGGGGESEERREG